MNFEHCGKIIMLKSNLNRVIEDSHANLLEVLKLYASMVVKRSISYNHAAGNIPSYDEDTTGLLIYNSLVMRSQNSIGEDQLTALLSARVLSLADARESLTLDDVYADVGRMGFSSPDDDATETDTPASTDSLGHRRVRGSWVHLTYGSARNHSDQFN